MCPSRNDQRFDPSHPTAQPGEAVFADGSGEVIDYWSRPLVDRLRERAAVARSEGTGTAVGDAGHFEEASAVLGEAIGYATRLATALHAKHYAEVEQWRPLEGDLIGLLTQIDNMTTGMTRLATKEPTP